MKIQHIKIIFKGNFRKKYITSNKYRKRKVKNGWFNHLKKLKKKGKLTHHQKKDNKMKKLVREKGNNKE